MQNKILIFGYGYVAKALSENLSNFEIISTSRSSKKSSTAKIIDFNREQIEREINNTSHIISTIPPDQNIGDPVIFNFGDIIEKAPNLKYIGYISATSVYGDHMGNWVDEKSALNLDNKRGKLRYKAENDWIKITKNKNIPLVIFRIAGIYGPERNAIETLKKGTARSIYKEGHFFSRIHIYDIISAIRATFEKSTKSEIYNLADDMPSASYEVIEHGANLLNINAPKRIPYDKANLSDMAKDFYSQNKKISNKKIKSDLGVKLKYPSYKEGLKDLL